MKFHASFHEARFGVIVLQSGAIPSKNGRPFLPRGQVGEHLRLSEEKQQTIFLEDEKTIEEHALMNAGVWWGSFVLTVPSGLI